MMPRVTTREVSPGTGSADPGARVARGRPAPRAPYPASRAPRSSPNATNTTHPAPETLGAFLLQERSSFGYAFQGVAYSWRTQRHLRLHAGIALVCIALGLWLSLRPSEWAALIAMIALVTTMELLNTVVEVVVDMISPEYHPGAKVAKDVAAGAVLISACGAALVGVFIFAPRLLALLR